MTRWTATMQDNALEQGCCDDDDLTEDETEALDEAAADAQYEAMRDREGER